MATSVNILTSNKEDNVVRALVTISSDEPIDNPSLTLAQPSTFNKLCELLSVNAWDYDLNSLIIKSAIQDGFRRIYEFFITLLKKGSDLDPLYVGSAVILSGSESVLIPGPEGKLENLLGDVVGDPESNVVEKINGTSVPATPTADRVLASTSGTASAWSLISDNHVSSSAAIDGSKINPNFGSQALVAGDGTFSGSVGISGTLTVPSLDASKLLATGQAQGSILYKDTTEWAQLPPGTAGQLLETGGAGANPSWVDAPVGITAPVSTTTDYTIQNGDGTVVVGTRAILITITLPTGATSGQRQTIKDKPGLASLYNIVVDGDGNNIDDQASVTVSQDYGSITVEWDGSAWMII